MSKECFASKREKAQKIHDWFNANENKSYVNFRRDMRRESNIVEYEDVKKLFGGRDFTVANIESII